MLPKPLRFLWGDLTGEEVKRFGFLSLTFFFIIGSYWLLRPLKDSIFKSLVGMSYQPKAKMLSLLIIIPLVLIYAKLVDVFEKQKLFYVICGFYGLLFLVIAYLLKHPTIGLANTVASPDRYLGWVTYVSIESLGSIVVALFWSFVASTTDPNMAKKGFPLIISGAQFGSILGPSIDRYCSHAFGLPLLTVIAALAIFIVPIMIFFFTNTILAKEPKKEVVPGAVEKPKTGIFEGAKLLLTKPYLLGVFAIATFYEVVGTIMDYQMKVLASNQFPNAEDFNSFMGMFGQASNFLALFMALIGTSYLMRKFGLTFCLLAFPVTVGLVVGYVYVNPMLYTVFAAMIVVKGLSYALNNPSKEMMYIPTSKDVKFKAKSWIDMFGSRSAKAAGSGVTNVFKDNAAELMMYGTLVAMGLIGVWIIAALLVGKTFNKLTKENKIIQ